MVKNADCVFDECLSMVSELVDEEKYIECAIYTGRLATTFCHMDFADGVLALEVLESIFLQMSHLREEHEISDEFQSSIHCKIKDDLAALQQAHRSKGDVYGALKRMRYHATQHQILAIKFPPRLEEPQDYGSDSHAK